MSQKTISILQSNYIPWKGNFDIINMVDEHYILDEVQYTKRDWRNRNRIVTREGFCWLTIPVKNRSFYQRIMDTEVTDRNWAEKHWTIISQSYNIAPFFTQTASPVKKLYEKASSEVFLSRINYIFLEGICRLLNISTPLSYSLTLEPKGIKSDRILDICVRSGADLYLTGPTAEDYLDLESFRDKDISVKWMSYSGYPEYEQLHDHPFCHNVSILDLLFCKGVEGAKSKMLSFDRQH